MIPTNRKVGFCTDHSIQETKALLLSLHHQRHDGPPAEESSEQVRSCRTFDLVGCQAQ